MDPYTLGGMIFSLVMVLVIGGFIVTFPLIRRLGALMEEYIRERRGSRLDQHQVAELQAEIADLRRSFNGIEREVTLLSERQEFTESLIDSVSRQRLASAVDRGTEDEQRR